MSQKKEVKLTYRDVAKTFGKRVELQNCSAFHVHPLLLLLHHHGGGVLLLLRLDLGLLGSHRLLLLTLLWTLLVRLRLRLGLGSLGRLWLLARLLGLRQLLRRRIGSRLRLRSGRLLLRWLRSRYRRGIGLRGGTPLVWRRSRLRLRSDTLSIVYVLGLCRCTLLRRLLAGLPCCSRLLDLSLVRLLLGLLHSEELLLLLKILRLPMGHLLELHLQINRTHGRIRLHGRDLSCIKGRCPIR